MPTSGPHNFAAFSSEGGNGGTIAWSNPAFAETDGAGRAVADGSFSGATISERLQALSAPGLSELPDADLVSEIVIEVDRHRVAFGPDVTDEECALVVGGAVQADNQASPDLWPTADGLKTYTFSGLSLTGAQVKAADFGFVLAADLPAGAVANVDYIRVLSVTHAPPGLSEATGPISRIEDRLAKTLAGAAAFRTWVGAADQAEALARIYFTALPDPADGAEEHTPAELATYRPYAIIYSDTDDGHRRAYTAGGLKHYSHQSGVLEVILEQATNPDALTNTQEADRLFKNAIGDILDDVEDLNGVSGYLAWRELHFFGPVRTHPNDVPAVGDAQRYLLRFHYGRQGG